MTAVATLAGADLALWTARAQKLNVVRDGEQDGAPWIVYFPNGFCKSFGLYGYRPDLNWVDGGPLIDQYIIAVAKGANQICFPGWHAKVGLVNAYDGDIGRQFGPMPLIAAMRALVWSVYGDNVPEVARP